MKVVVVLMLVVLGGCVSAPPVEVQGVGDPLAPTLTVSTYGFHLDDPLMGVVRLGRPDTFFRAFKAKQSGAVSYQVYVRSQEMDWMRYSSARWLVGDKLVSRQVRRLSYSAECRTLPCSMREDFAFDLSGDELIWLSRQTGPVTVRMVGRIDRDAMLLPDEAQRLLAEVDKLI